MYPPYFVSLYHQGVPALPLAPGGQPALGPAVLLLGNSDHPAVVDDDDVDDDADDEFEPIVLALSVLESQLAGPACAPG